MQPGSFTDQAPEEAYWNSWIRHGEFWHRLSPAERALVLALPVLRHPVGEIPWRQDSVPVEAPPQIAAILKGHGSRPDDQHLLRVLRLMQVHQVAGDLFDASRDPRLRLGHLFRHVLSADSQWCFAGEREWGWHDRRQRPERIDAGQFGSRARFRDFLAIPQGENGLRWEKEWRLQQTGNRDLVCFSGVHVTAAARHILQAIVDAGRPLPLATFRDDPRIPEKGGILGKALRGLTQWVLALVGYDPELDDLVIGLWPDLRARLDAVVHPPPLPGPVAAPAESFSQPFLASHVGVLLTAAAHAPLRVKQSGEMALYAATVRELRPHMIEVPEWIEPRMFAQPLATNIAMMAALSFGWLESELGGVVVATPKGREWLAGDAKARLKQLIGKFRARIWKSPKRYEDPHWSYSVFHSGYCRSADVSDWFWIDEGLIAAWRLAPADGAWRPLEAFLDHAIAARNPFVRVLGPGGRLVVARRSEWGSLRWQRHEAEDMVAEARAELINFLYSRLIPVGGVELGRQGDGTLLFRVNGIGRCYLGAADDFEFEEHSAAGRVLVQPNHEIVFLGGNLAAESAIAPFAERVGQRTGVLFRLTKASVQQAVHRGWDAPRMLAVLGEHGDQPVPANVAAEIVAWAGSRRAYRLRRTTLVECPDRETALRLHGAVPAATRLLTDTLLELTGKLTTAQRRRLEKAGLFEDQSKAAGGDDGDFEDSDFEWRRASAPRKKRRKRRW